MKGGHERKEDSGRGGKRRKGRRQLTGASSCSDCAATK